MDLTALRKRFVVPGITFDQQGDLVRVQVSTQQAVATIYLQGAHLTAWQPSGYDPAILLSHKSEFAVGKAIRGGIPIVFPWFAGDRKLDRVNGHPGPSHGFARIQDWEVKSIERLRESVRIEFTLGPTDLSRSMGYDHFLLSLTFNIGRELTLAMTVTNTGDLSLDFEQAFHTYYKVADIHEVTVSGLEPTSFIDKTDKMTLKPAEGQPIRFSRTLDRVYNNTASTCVIHDNAGRRRINVQKFGSNSTVVWNPWAELPDLGPWDWHEYVAVETANVGENAISLAPGKASTMQVHVVMERG